MKYNFSDHYLVYTEFEFNVINQKGSTHNVMKFRDMKRFNPENFLNDLNSCEVIVHCMMKIFPGKNGS